MKWSITTPVLFLVGTLAVCTADRPRQEQSEVWQEDNLEWIRGTWRSYKLDYGKFGEWEGAERIELVASCPDEIDLFLISAKGKRWRAFDSQPSIMSERTLFFGPIGSGLLFRYRHVGDILVLDLKTSDGRIHAELRREKE